MGIRMWTWLEEEGHWERAFEVYILSVCLSVSASWLQVCKVGEQLCFTTPSPP
jgi:hypothetical protein